MDVSGGCGTMYNITVASKLFNDRKIIDQHKMVSSILQNEITSMHGLTIKTRTKEE